MPKKKEEEEEGEMLMFLQKDPLYSGLVEEENINSIKQGNKTGAKTMGLEKIMTLMVEYQVKEALI